jgi:hypothetical protein
MLRLAILCNLSQADDKFMILGKYYNFTYLCVYFISNGISEKNKICRNHWSLCFNFTLYQFILHVYLGQLQAINQL